MSPISSGAARGLLISGIRNTGIVTAVTPSNIVTLLHFDGADNSTTFTDSSLNNLSFTRSGTVAISTTQSKFGDSSAYFNGGVNYITSTSQSVLGLGTSNYTVECQIYATFPTATSNYYHVFAIDSPSGGCQLRFGDSGFGHRLQFNAGLGLSAVFGITLTKSDFVNTWKHVAVVRNNGVMTIYVDGVTTTRWNSGPETGTTVAHNLGTSATLTVGTNGNSFLGYVDEFKVSNKAKYTSNFTPPSSPFTNP